MKAEHIGSTTYKSHECHLAEYTDTLEILFVMCILYKWERKGGRRELIAFWDSTLGSKVGKLNPEKYGFILIKHPRARGH